jgi:hypothetical protein
MKKTIESGEFYFVLRQICNSLRKQRMIFNQNEWDLVVITNNFNISHADSTLIETKQLSIVVNNIKNNTMLIYQKEFEDLDLLSGSTSNMRKYIHISCAVFVLQKISFQNNDSINMFCRNYLYQLEQIVYFFRLTLGHSSTSRWILSDFILSNLAEQDAYHNISLDKKMTGTLGNAIQLAYAKCRLASHHLKNVHVSNHKHKGRFDLNTVEKITHICGIVKLIRKNALKFVRHMTRK